jgi:hypothetical protein
MQVGRGVYSGRLVCSKEGAPGRKDQTMPRHLLPMFKRDSDTSLGMDKNDSRRKIISFYPHRNLFLALFDELFMFYF